MESAAHSSVGNIEGTFDCYCHRAKGYRCCLCRLLSSVKAPQNSLRNLQAGKKKR